MTLFEFYEKLLPAYGPQGWWPLATHAGSNPTKTGAIQGYHPGDYSFPRNDSECFEICVGAILTQNTAWLNAEKAILALHHEKGLAHEAILQLPAAKLAALIRPCGYFNMKAKKLRHFAEFALQIRDRIPERDELLTIWGIGPETADSMLLYAYRREEMVVDAYTRRILSRHGFIKQNISYADLKLFCEANLPKDLIVYQEFHALMVEHAKRCRKEDAGGC